MAIHLGPWLPMASCRLPGDRAEVPLDRSPVVPLSDVAPGGACRAAAVARSAVSSYLAVSPLPPRTRAVCSLWRCPWGYPRRALPGTVSPWSPDFPRCLATPRPSNHPHAVRFRPVTLAGQRPASVGPDGRHGRYHWHRAADLPAPAGNAWQMNARLPAHQTTNSPPPALHSQCDWRA